MKFKFAESSPLTHTRRVALAEPLLETTVTAIRERLAAVGGVAWVELSVGEKSLRLAYNTSVLGYRQAVEELEQAGATIDNGRFSRWRGVWYGFVDDNIRENAAANPTCCSKPPPGTNDPKR